MRRFIVGITICFGLTACSGPLTQFNFTAAELQRSPNFSHTELEEGKVAILSAVAVDVYHEYRRVLGDSFSKALRQTYPDIPQIPPQKTLSLLNRADLADEYIAMIRGYENAGILGKSSLKRFSQVLGVQYMIQVSLLQYTQDTATRFSLLGLRLFQTRSSTLRVFAQIWDASTGGIVWEGSSSATIAGENVSEKPIPFEEVATRAWEELIKKLP
jgi:hypothetical protein